MRRKSLFYTKASWRESKKRILQTYLAHAIVPVGKSDDESIWTKKRILERYGNTVQGFFFSFIVAIHPLPNQSKWTRIEGVESKEIEKEEKEEKEEK